MPVQIISILTSDGAGVDFVAGGGANMPRTIPARPAETTPETIDHRAKLYSLAAAAAGVSTLALAQPAEAGFVLFYSLAAAVASVSVLALAQPAEAEIIITNKTIPIPNCNPTYYGPCPVSIDLNNDGITDLKFEIGSNFGASGGFSYLSVKGMAGGEVVASQGAHRGYASALMRSAKIGPSAHFGRAGKYYLMEEKDCFEGSCYPPIGKWGGDHPNRFVGVKFKIDGAIHYGWVRVTVKTSTKRYYVTGTVTEYGYETIANKPVFAGLTGKNVPDDEASESNAGPSLGALALGADGLALWRREEALVP
jgi:hypothetical protein